MVITPKEYISILKNPETLNSEHLHGIKSIVEKYPYFQSARAIYLKGLKNQDSYKYNNELKMTAAYTTDREVLFDFITSKAFDAQKHIHTAISAKLKSEETPQEPVAQNLELGRPLSFDKNETHSFNQWLQLSVKKPIVREEVSERKAEDKASIIDRFIKNNPKITPAKKGVDIDISIAKNKEDSSLMTETLARVYLEQKKYDSAIKAYKILSLKYPEKSGFFADQIKRVQNLQKHRS